MKKLLLLALCLILSANADARTLYVDARRPNNNGNGYSLKRAKKTIQAAINVAKNGDTILVYPGCYRGVVTNNKKIKIKSKSGAGKTEIGFDNASPLKLGKNSSGKGIRTTLLGFFVTWIDSYSWGLDHPIHGGTVKSCILKNTTIFRSKLIGCTLYLTTNGSIYASLDRCKIVDGRGDFSESKFFNCLFANNKKLELSYSTLANCTIADNDDVDLVFVKANNTIFHKVPARAFRKSQQNKLKNCYQGSNPKFVSTKSAKKTWIAAAWGDTSRIVGAEVFQECVVGAEVYWEDIDDWNNCGYVTVSGITDAEILAAAKARVGLLDAKYDINDYNYAGGYVTVSGTTDAEILAAAKTKPGNPNDTYSIDCYNYERGEYKTETIPGAYRLKKGSPCINKGKLTAKLKKLVGKKDLAGKKRVKGKSVDIGCYEY